MADLEKIVDKFSGFITKEQAEYILENTDHKPRKSNFNVKELLKSIAEKNQGKNGDAVEGYAVNVKDKVYRIFNPLNVNRNGSKRVMILGEEGSTIALNLNDKLSEFADINSLERGDVVLVNNVFVNQLEELKTAPTSNINRIIQSKIPTIADYSSINEELRKVDAVGKIMEISPIRHVNRLGSQGQTAVASCIVSDLANTIEVSCWGSSAILTATLKVNDFVKMEFCDIRMRNGKFTLYVNDDSRIFKANTAAARLAQNRK